MIAWLKQVAGDFVELVNRYPAMILFVVIVLILVAVVWIWLKVPDSKVGGDETKWWANLSRWIKEKLAALWEWLSHIVQHLFISSSDNYQTPLYLQLKPDGRSSVFNTMPAGELKRSVPDFMRQMLMQSSEDSWYFLKHMTLVELSIDTSGNDAAETPESAPELAKNTLRAVQHTIEKISNRRPQRPLDGVLISIPADLLTDATSPELNKLLERMVLSLALIDSDVPFALPVYLLVSHCESMPGFNAFAQQNWEQHDQIFGWSSDVEFGEKYQSKIIPRAFSFIHQQVVRNQVERSARQVDLIQGDQFILLDRHVKRLTAGVKLAGDKIFDDSSYKNGFYFRGLYFVGRSLEEEHLERSAGNIFLNELLEQKISAEANLAIPTGRGALQHKHLLDRYKQVSLTALILLFVLGGWNLWSLKTQIDGVSDTLVGSDVKQLSVGTGYAQVYRVLDQLSTIDASHFKRIGLPASWFANVDDNLVQVISDNHLEGIVFPDMECNLRTKFNTLLRYNPQFSDSGGADGFRWVFAEAWLNELDQFQSNRQSFIELSEPRNSQQPKILEQFSNLIYALYGVKPGSGFFHRSQLYKLALERLDYPYQSTNSKCPDGSTGVDKQSSSLFWSFVNQNASKLYTRIQATSLSPSGMVSSTDLSGRAGEGSSPVIQLPSGQGGGDEYVALDRWFDYLEQKWLGNNASANPCHELRERLSGIQLGWDNHSQSSMRQATSTIALFDRANCEDVFYQQLLRNSYTLVSEPFVRDAAGNVQLSPGMIAFRGNYGSIQDLSFMSLDTSKLPAQSPPIIQWDIARLLEALGYYREYENYAMVNFSSIALPSPDQTDADAYALQSAMLSQLRNAIVYQLEWARHGSASSAPKSSDVVNGTEQQVLQRVRNLDSVVNAFYQLRDILAQLGFAADSEAWVETTRASALSILQATDQLANSSRLYLSQVQVNPDDIDILHALYGISTAADLKDYLATQNERAAYIAYNYAESPVTYLLNSLAGQSSSQSTLEQRWQETLVELDKFARKDPSNKVTALENQFSGALGVQLADCPSDYLVGAGQDIFTQAENYLTLSIKVFCDRVKATDAADHYDALVKQFASTLQGRYPFVDSTSSGALEAQDASLVAVRNFFDDFDKVCAELLQEFTEKDKQAQQSNDTSYQAPLAFVQQLDSISKFLALTMESSSGTGTGGITLSPSFRIYTTPSMGLDQIIVQSLETNDQSASMPGSNKQIQWYYGSAIDFSARLANTSAYQLNTNPNNQASIHNSTITFTETGNWALMKMVQRYRVARGLQPTISNPGSLILEFPVSVKRAKSTADLSASTIPPLVPSVFKVPVGVNLYGLNSETKQLELLEFPDSFPFSAPTL